MATTDTRDDIGRLDQRVIIQQKSTANDTQGGRAVTPATLATVFAAVRASGGGETQQAEAVSSQVRYEVEIRYRNDVLATMKLSWTPFTATSAKTLQILAVRLKDGRPDRLLLECEEVA